MSLHAGALLAAAARGKDSRLNGLLLGIVLAGLIATFAVLDPRAV